MRVPLFHTLTPQPSVPLRFPSRIFQPSTFCYLSSASTIHDQSSMSFEVFSGAPLYKFFLHSSGALDRNQASSSGVSGNYEFVEEISL